MIISESYCIFKPKLSRLEVYGCVTRFVTWEELKHVQWHSISELKIYFVYETCEHIFFFFLIVPSNKGNYFMFHVPCFKFDHKYVIGCLKSQIFFSGAARNQQQNGGAGQQRFIRKLGFLGL